MRACACVSLEYRRRTQTKTTTTTVQNEASYLPSDTDVHGGVVVFVQRHSCVSDTVQQQCPVKNRAQHLSTVSSQRLGATSER